MKNDLAELEAWVRRGDWLALLGVGPGYDLDLRRLKERYLELARATHPDFFAGDAEQLPRAELVAAGLNRAMTVLEDPVRRAEYLLGLHGGAGGAERNYDKRVGAEVLQRTMSVQEAIEDAAGDAAKLEAIRRELLTERGRLLGRIREWALQLPLAPGAPAAAAVRAGLRGALNEMSYLAKLLAAAEGRN